MRRAASSRWSSNGLTTSTLLAKSFTLRGAWPRVAATVGADEFFAPYVVDHFTLEVARFGAGGVVETTTLGSGGTFYGQPSLSVDDTSVVFTYYTGGGAWYAPTDLALAPLEAPVTLSADRITGGPTSLPIPDGRAVLWMHATRTLRTLCL